MTFAVATDHLTRRFAKRTVVDDVSLRIPAGCVYGFLGPNGSGKSTTMKMLLSLVQPTAGEVRLFDEPMTRATRRRILRQVGSLIEQPPGYPHLTGRENLRIVQRLLDLPDRSVASAVDAVRMGAQLDKLVRHYSLGMQQRLGIAMALAREPRLLILDEPTNGLDPEGIHEIRALLRALAADGTTVMVSSHLLGEIDRTATMLGILSEGRLIFQGTRSELLAAAAPDVVIATSDPQRSAAVLSRFDARVRPDGAVAVSNLDDARTEEAVAALVGDGIGVRGVARDEQTLEDVFRDLTKAGAL